MSAFERVRSVLAEPTPTDGAEMDHYELGSRWPWRTWPSFTTRSTGSAWLAASPAGPKGGTGTGRQGRRVVLVETARRLTARAAAAGSGPGPGTEEGAMLVPHRHEAGVFGAGHCRARAPTGRPAGPLPARAEQEEATLREAHGWVSVALWSAGAAILLVVVALWTG
jgi:hypothetical protein